VSLLIDELQIRPWSSEVFYRLQDFGAQTINGWNKKSTLHQEYQQVKYDNSTEHYNDIAPILSADSNLLSQWLVLLFDNCLGTADMKSLDTLNDWTQSTDHASADVPLNQLFCGGAGGGLALFARDTSQLPSQADLLSDVEALRVSHHVLADKVRFLRNEVWWLERRGSASGTASNSYHSQESFYGKRSSRHLTSSFEHDDLSEHWTSAHFGVQRTSGVPTDQSHVQYQHQSPSSNQLQYPQISSRVRATTSSSVVTTAGSVSVGTTSTASAVNVRPGGIQECAFEGNSPLQDSDGMVTATGSSPPVVGSESLSDESPGLDTGHNNNSQDTLTVDARMNEAALKLLELDGWPLSVLRGLAEDQSTRTTSNGGKQNDDDNRNWSDIIPIKQQLLELIEKQVTINGDVNWEKSPLQVQQLIQEILKDYSGKKYHKKESLEFNKDP